MKKYLFVLSFILFTQNYLAFADVKILSAYDVELTGKHAALMYDDISQSQDVIDRGNYLGVYVCSIGERYPTQNCDNHLDTIFISIDCYKNQDKCVLSTSNWISETVDSVKITAMPYVKRRSLASKKIFSHEVFVGIHVLVIKK